MDSGIYVGFGLLVLFTIGCVWSRANDKRRWNNGICRENGLSWECFDMASDGSRGYKTVSRVAGEPCQSIWISWGVDK